MEARITLCLGEYAKGVYRSLKAETLQPAPAKGTARVSLVRGGECLEIEIESRDLSGLRALVNSYLLLVHAAYSSLRVVSSK